MNLFYIRPADTLDTNAGTVHDCYSLIRAKAIATAAANESHISQCVFSLSLKCTMPPTPLPEPTENKQD